MSNYIDTPQVEWVSDPLQEPPDLNGIPATVTTIRVAGGEMPVHSRWLLDLLTVARANGMQFIFEGWGEWVPVDADHEHLVAEASELAYIAIDGTFLPDFEAAAEHAARGGARAERCVRVGRDRAGRMLRGHIYPDDGHAGEMSER